MTWSYSGDPKTSPLDEKRFIIGDVKQDEPIMQNEEIQYLIDTYSSNENKLLYQLFSRAATLFARDIKRSLGPQAEDPTERLKFFKEQSEYYRKLSTSAGLSLPAFAHKKVFRIGMQNNPPYNTGE